MGFDSSEQFLFVKGLGDVVNCTRVKPFDFAHRIIERGHKNDGNMGSGWIVSELLAHFKPIHP